MEDKAGELLRGAIDVHIHTGPDIYPRLVTDLDAARQAKEAGMRAILLKSHVTITADRARMAEEAVGGIKVMGAVTLNYPVGGLNSWAVSTAADLGARLVWMPTTHAAKYIENVSHVPMFAKKMPKDIVGITVLDGNGRLKEELRPILGIVAEEEMVLGTGHISAREGLALIEEAVKAGVKRITVTHPLASWVGYSLEEMKEAIRRGASALEHTWNDTTPHVAHPIEPRLIAETIKEIGPENSIMSSDGGQSTNPPPVEMMRSFIAAMLKEGFSEDEIRKMTRDNPERIYLS